jgi:GTP 3',8-cyclase
VDRTPESTLTAGRDALPAIDDLAQSSSPSKRLAPQGREGGAQTHRCRCAASVVGVGNVSLEPMSVLRRTVVPPVSLGIPQRGGAALRPPATELIDQHGRVATDLRISLTDRCNLRCQYCMPADGVPWIPGPQLLSRSEFQRLMNIAVVRLGEPLLHPELAKLVAAAGALTPRPELAMTTNAVTLSRHAASLAAAGLNRINVSLDSIDRETYAQLTRRDRLPDVLEGLQAATAAGIAPIKINAVVIAGGNEHAAADLLAFCIENNYQLRFIEQMPLDGSRTWSHSSMVTADEILARLRRRFALTPDERPRGSAPAQRWRIVGTDHTVGIIASVSRPFCGDCDRVRLTADGTIRNCLFAHEETDLRAMLRNPAVGDEEIAQAWREAMWHKRPGHGINDPSFLQPQRTMSAIGG